MKTGIILGLSFFGLLILPTIIFKLWWWMWFYIAVGIVLIIFEVVATIRTGKTISNIFREYLKEHRTKALIIAGCWLSFFLYLIVLHLIMGY